MASRQEVFEAINGEREYQDTKWSSDTTLAVAAMEEHGALVRSEEGPRPVGARR